MLHVLEVGITPVDERFSLYDSENSIGRDESNRIQCVALSTVCLATTWLTCHAAPLSQAELPQCLCKACYH